MKLRPGELSDASSIAVLSSEVWTGTYLKRGVNGFFAGYVLETFTQEKTEALITDPRQVIVVSENEDGIDGVMRLTFETPAPVAGCSDTEIVTLYVQPRHHGKGIGKALLEAARAEAVARGIPSLWLATNAENAPAIGFYLANGFEQVGETHFRIGDEGYLNNVYRWHLN